MATVTGLHIVRASVRAVTLEGRPGRLRTVHAAEQRIEAGDDRGALARAIQAVLPEPPLHSGTVQVVLGADLLFPLTLKVPPTSSRKIRLTIPFEAERLVAHGSTEDHLYGHRVMARGKGGATVWACGAPRATIARVSDALRRSGLEVEECLVEGFVSAQLVAGSGWCSPPHLWCHLDGHDSTLILTQGAGLPAVRSLKLGRVTSETLAREAGRMTPETGHAATDTLSKTISGNGHLGSSEEDGLLPLPHGTGRIDPGFLAATGAALRGLDLLDPGPVLEVTPTPRVVRGIRAMSPGIAACLLGVTLLAATLGFRQGQRQEQQRDRLETLAGQQSELFTRAFPGRPPADGALPEQLYQMLSELERARARRATRHSALELLDEIVTHLPSPSSTALRVRTMHVEGTSALLEARAVVTTGPAEGIALEVERRLRESERLEASAENITLDPNDPTRVTFRVRIATREGSSP